MPRRLAISEGPTPCQNLEIQEVALKAAGCEVIRSEIEGGQIFQKVVQRFERNSEIERIVGEFLTNFPEDKLGRSDSDYNFAIADRLQSVGIPNIPVGDITEQSQHANDIANTLSELREEKSRYINGGPGREKAAAQTVRTLQRLRALARSASTAN
jgi:hypothetical protein